MRRLLQGITKAFFCSMSICMAAGTPLASGKIFSMQKVIFKTDYVPKMAILKEDAFSYTNSKKRYAKKHEMVTIVDLKGHVAICVKQDEDWFPVNVNKLIIQE